MNKKLIDLSLLSTPQLRAMRDIIEKGVLAVSNTDKPKEIPQESPPDVNKDKEAEVIRMDKELESALKEKSDLEGSLREKETDIAAKASQIEALTTEFNDLKTEVEGLRTYKEDRVKSDERAELVKARKSKIEDAGLEIDIEADADKWLEMSDDVFAFTIAKMSELRKGSNASASLKIPALTGDESDPKETVREALQEHKAKSR